MPWKPAESALTTRYANSTTKPLGKALQNEKLFSCVCVLLRRCSENLRKQFVKEFRSAREDREIGLAV
ncbi:unnamed protein product [Sphagnum jensenii]|uniref:Uncharacterized protein n=1 Tax=Sphagnum jensenii TaxID=128206 RepID=A0ABP1BLK6_9BRYO